MLLRYDHPCNTYVAYRAFAPEFLDLGRIFDLFGVGRLSIAEASNLVSEEIQKSDTFYHVSTTIFENLTSYHVVEDLNPLLELTLQHIGNKVVFPLFCKCPTAADKENGFKFLITYVWQPSDDLLLVRSKLNVSAVDIVTENNYQNFIDAVNLLMLNPISELPVISQPHPTYTEIHSKHHRIIIISLAAGLTLVVLVTFLMMKPVIYETGVIVEAIMNLNESNRIGGTVYTAMIDGQAFAVKKCKEDATEELKILQKVNHSNLVTLKGFSSDEDGNFFLGKKAMETKENGEIVMLRKDTRGILEDEENRADRLKKWMYPTLETFYPIDGALSLAALAKVCTPEKSALWPQMTEIVLNLSSDSFERSWILDPEEINQIISPIKAR
ncbi:hypothetical protein RJ641_010504 [Dillenia turbinata]|uniref:Protein kinase domain-containing protein n=1 Tax=Dillenia turbinata TaxID=194707 RepID=A0AAN8V3L4_9MAGN